MAKRIRDPAKIREYNKKFYENNKEYFRARSILYRAVNGCKNKKQYICKRKDNDIEIYNIQKRFQYHYDITLPSDVIRQGKDDLIRMLKDEGLYNVNKKRSEDEKSSICDEYRMYGVTYASEINNIHSQTIYRWLAKGY